MTRKRLKEGSKERRQLTIRGFDRDLERRLRELAASQQISLNRAALSLMRRGAGLADRSETRATADRVGTALDSFIGVWSKEDETEFLRALEPLEQIDPELWS
jgi:hypothetical protein